VKNIRKILLFLTLTMGQLSYTREPNSQYYNDNQAISRYNDNTNVYGKQDNFPDSANYDARNNNQQFSNDYTDTYPNSQNSLANNNPYVTVYPHQKNLPNRVNYDQQDNSQKFNNGKSELYNPSQRAATANMSNATPLKTSRNQEISVDSLTQESYITPEMQGAAVAINPVGKNQQNYLSIDKQTGAVNNIQSVDSLLKIIAEAPTHESHKNALHAMLEATDIALFVTMLNAKYEDPKFVNSPDLIEGLNQQKKEIQTMLSAINKGDSYYSWIFGGNAANKNIQTATKPILFDANASTIDVPVNFIGSIIKQNDYKQKPDATVAANLLFQQCFIAQQHRFANPIAIDLKRTLTTANYIYTDFPKIYNKLSNKYPICDEIIAKENGKFKLDKDARRSRLLQIRQAVQTALFIANKKSDVNIGYLLPASVLSYLDSVVSELMRYDAYLNTLCLNGDYGARPEDAAKIEGWSTMSKVAAGIAITAAVVGTVYTYDKFNDTNHLGTAYNQTTGAVNQATQQASDVMNWVAASPGKLKNDVSSLLGKITPSNPFAAKPVVAQPAAVAKKPELSWLDQRLANANKAYDRGIDHAQLDADEKKYEAAKKTISSSLQATTGVASNFTYEAQAKSAAANVKSTEKERIAAIDAEKAANEIVTNQERLLEKETKKQQLLTNQLQVEKNALERASIKNPKGFFDAPAVAEAKAKIFKIEQEQRDNAFTISSQQDKLDTIKERADEKRKEVELAKSAEDAAIKDAADKKFLAQVYKREQELPSSFTNKIAEATDAIADKAQSIPYNLTKYEAGKSLVNINKANEVANDVAFVNEKLGEEKWNDSVAGKATGAVTGLYNWATSSSAPAKPAIVATSASKNNNQASANDIFDNDINYF
jgi:hypothetical protein